MIHPQPIFDPRSLLAVFRDEDFHFHLRGRRDEPRAMFQPAPDHDAVLCERRHWYESEPEKYAAITSEGISMLLEIADSLRRWGLNAPTETAAGSPSELGRRWEADFVLLHHGKFGGPIRVIGGAVCMPTNWDFPSIMGHRVDEVHAGVPGLNAVLGQKIDALIAGLVPGSAWFRANWGLSRSCEMNQHPSRGLTRLDDGNFDPERLWLRIERQMLWRLPVSDGVVFAIRPFHFPLVDILSDPPMARGFHRLLRTMPAVMKEYKGFAERWMGIAGNQV